MGICGSAQETPPQRVEAARSLRRASSTASSISGVKYTDPDFSASPDSVSKKLGWRKSLQISEYWSRLDPEYKKVVDDTFSPDDIPERTSRYKCGRWVAGALASIAYAAPAILTKGPTVVTKERRPDGLLQVRLGLFGSDEIVTIDEQLPFSNADAKPAFMNVPDGRKLCIGPVVEKAMAKKRGSYESLERETLKTSLEAITGRACIEETLHDLQQRWARRAWWRRLRQYLQAGHLVVVGPAPNVEGNRRMSMTQSLAGFSPNHPYVIVGTTELLPHEVQHETDGDPLAGTGGGGANGMVRGGLTAASATRHMDDGASDGDLADDGVVRLLQLRDPWDDGKWKDRMKSTRNRTAMTFAGSGTGDSARSHGDGDGDGDDEEKRGGAGADDDAAEASAAMDAVRDRTKGWRGNWSPGSPTWTPEASYRCQALERDDAVFWIADEDIVTFFYSMTVCKTNLAFASDLLLEKGAAGAGTTNEAHSRAAAAAAASAAPVVAPPAGRRLSRAALARSLKKQERRKSQTAPAGPVSTDVAGPPAEAAVAPATGAWAS